MVAAKTGVIRKQSREASSLHPQRPPLEVFISYASDLEAESLAVNRAVERVSRVCGSRLGITLQPVLFKRDMVPVSGDRDPQVEINARLKRATFFIGLMWTRFGTRTPRARSGMQEEYDLALHCRRTRAAMFHVAYYFCCRKPVLNRVDPDQLESVNTFRSRVSANGIFAEFVTKTQLEERVRDDLERVVFAWQEHREILDRRMNKQELSRVVAAKSHTSIKKSGRFVSTLEVAIKNEMAHGGKVALVGFGTFGVKERKARKGVNPKTLKAIMIPKKKAMFFKPGKALRDAVAKK